MSNDDDNKRTRSWSTWLKPNDEPTRSRKSELHELHQHAQREAKEHIEASRHHDMDDPFIAFKHFIDRSISSLSAIPHTMAASMREGQAIREEQGKMEIDFNDRWTGVPRQIRDDKTIAATARRSIANHAEDAAALLIRESERRNAHIPVHKVAALYHDREDLSTERPSGPFLSPGGACYYKSEDHDNLPSSAYGARRAREPRWLSIDWFKSSRYSPIRLEMDTQLGQYDTKWRNAFEDLLEAALDKPMTSQEKFGYRFLPAPIVSRRQSTWRGCGLDWMCSLQCRGILPPQLPSMYHPVFRVSMPTIMDEFQQLVRELQTPPSFWSIPDRTRVASGIRDAYVATQQPDTELDMYERSEPKRRGTCPDAVGRAISEGVYQERQQLERDSQDQFGRCPDELGHAMGQAARDEGRCPDELGRAVGQASRGEGMAELLELLGLSTSVKSDIAANESVDESNEDTFAEEDLERMAASTSFESLPVHRQLMMLETQTRMRLILAREEDDDCVPAVTGDQSFEERWEQTVEQLEQQNMSRLLAAREEADEEHQNIRRLLAAHKEVAEDIEEDYEDDEDDDDDDYESARSLKEYQTMLILLEQQNKHRLHLPRQEQDSLVGVVRDGNFDLGDDEIEKDEDAEDLPGELWSQARVEHQRSELERRKPQQQRALAHSDSVDAGERPQVLSTLTTTQTNRSADGTVTTKVVLKRCFADGSEETHERSRTFNDNNEGAQQPVEKAEAKKEKSKGWFWS